MKGVRINVEGQKDYALGDVVITVPDNYVFAGNDLDNGRSEELLGALSDSDAAKLVMMDEVLDDYSATSLPTFRSISLKRENMKINNRRKYTFNTSVELKQTS